MDSILHGITNEKLKEILKGIYARDPDQPEYLNAVNEVAKSIQPLLDTDGRYLPIFSQMCEPERQIIFRVPWLDDQNNLRVNRGYRVQFSSAIGPYKGGTRFHRSVNLSIIKMLGFEQVFKNALTTLPLGAGKGGSDFDPKGKSDGEIMRFCQSYMTELARYVAGDVDVPAGDIGVGGKEIGYMYGQYKRLNGGKFEGALTGKGMSYGGSWCRPEATGFGVVFLAREFLPDIGVELKGARCALSGSGNVARFCASKLEWSGAKVVSMSDSKGTLIEPDGFTREQLQQVRDIKSTHNGSLEDYSSDTCVYLGNRQKPWQAKELERIDVAFPCATQNELDEADVDALVKKGCKAIIEGANMPTTAAGVDRALEHKLGFVPGKMANSGGVAVSGLEMAQNRSMLAWEGKEVYEKLEKIMREVYVHSKKCAEDYNVSLADGANIYAFLKVGSAVMDQGAV
ncbi:hypothetical protein M9435_000372 [Picochlorum sp. BPE23]|nr:hypothetical protein M9435_000372 [Picochlorum sp. BPE23]